MKRHHCNIPRDVVRLLGTFAILGLLGLIVLVYVGKSVPEGLLTLIAGAVGALGSILSSTRPPVEDPQPVTVENLPSDPVPVEGADVGRT